MCECCIDLLYDVSNAFEFASRSLFPTSTFFSILPTYIILANSQRIVDRIDHHTHIFKWRCMSNDTKEWDKIYRHALLALGQYWNNNSANRVYFKWFLYFHFAFCFALVLLLLTSFYAFISLPSSSFSLHHRAYYDKACE